MTERDDSLALKDRELMRDAGISPMPARWRSVDMLAVLLILALGVAEMLLLAGIADGGRAARSLPLLNVLFAGPAAYNAWKSRQERIRAWRKAAEKGQKTEVRNAVRRTSLRFLRTLQLQQRRRRSAPRVIGYPSTQWPPRRRDTRGAVLCALLFFLGVVAASAGRWIEFRPLSGAGLLLVASVASYSLWPRPRAV